jgi:hypothetical protein
MRNMAEGIPGIFISVLKAMVEGLELTKERLICRLVSVQLVRFKGSARDGPYPSHGTVLHRDNEHYPQGGVLAVYLHSSEFGAIRTVSFGKNQERTPFCYFNMCVGGAYFMGPNLFAKAKMEEQYRHGVENHLEEDGEAFVILFRFKP